MTLSDLEKEDSIKHLLESPAPVVVGKLIVELRKYIEFVNDIRSRRSPLDEDDINELLERYEI